MVPLTLRIGGHVHTVKEVGSDDFPKDIMADMDCETNAIRITRGAAPSRKIELILHEALHAMLSGHGNVEGLVVILGESLTAFIKDNPAFIKYALKVLSK